MAVASALLATQCGPSPTPEMITVVETVIVEKEVKGETITVVETVEIVQTVEVEVEKIVEIEVTAEPPALPYEGVEINILTVTGPQIAEPIQRRGTEFADM